MVGIGGNPSGNAKLSVINPYYTSVLQLKGINGGYHYSQILLSSDEGSVSKTWEVNHTNSNAFALLYYDGASSWTQQFSVSPAGLVTLGSSMTSAVRLDVMGNAQFRSVGSGAYVAPLNISADGVLTVSTSDARLKTNISSIPDALAKVQAIRGVTFNWLSDEQAEKKIGFIAQEVEEVLPELVFTNPVDGYKGVNYAEMTAVLTEAVKEQQVQIEMQNQKIEQLEKMICEMEKKIASSLRSSQ
jgi:hypothetical protein